MENFEFYNPCRILFGDGKLDRLGELIRAYSDNILLVYGKSSIRKMGLYDEIVTILNRDGIRFTEISGVEYIERGYECIESTLTSIGADIKKI